MRDGGETRETEDEREECFGNIQINSDQIRSNKSSGVVLSQVKSSLVEYSIV